MFTEYWEHTKMLHVHWVAYATVVNKHSQKMWGGGDSKKTEYGSNLHFINYTKGAF